MRAKRRTVASLLLVLFTSTAAAAAGDGAGDAARGERVFQRCFACHSVDPAERNLQGPNLHGVVGRRAATLPEFEYSPAMLALGKTGLVWTGETLARFLTDPQGLVPGNAMGFFGLPSAEERADLIRYLERSGRP